MKRKRYTETQIIGILKEAEQGVPVTDLCRNHLYHPRYTHPDLATGPNQVWSWDIKKLRAAREWTYYYYYLYALLDIFSRYVAGRLLSHCESGEVAAELSQ